MSNTISVAPDSPRLTDKQNFGDEKKHIYIVFSSTPYKTGTFIRACSRYYYNHVSISLDRNLSQLYSFSRRYKNTPFCGGFVRESVLRYHNNGRYARLKICEIEVEPTRYRQIIALINEMDKDKLQYVYNMISAGCFLFHRRINIENALTCIEFCADIVSKCEICESNFFSEYVSIKELDSALQQNMIFEGSAEEFFDGSSWGEDMYLAQLGIMERTRVTLKSNLKLLRNWIRT